MVAEFARGARMGGQAWELGFLLYRFPKDRLELMNWSIVDCGMVCSSHFKLSLNCLSPVLYAVTWGTVFPESQSKIESI